MKFAGATEAARICSSNLVCITLIGWPISRYFRLYLAGTKSDGGSTTAVQTTDDAPGTVTNDLVNAISRYRSKNLPKKLSQKGLKIVL